MSSLHTKYFPVDGRNGYLQLMITTDEDTQESLGDMNEALATLLGLQHLYAVGVMNFGGEEVVNDILRETIHPELDTDEPDGPALDSSSGTDMDSGV